MTEIQRLRTATEDDIDAALDRMILGNKPMNSAQLLEFFNAMIDIKLGDGAGMDE